MHIICLYYIYIYIYISVPREASEHLAGALAPRLAAEGAHDDNDNDNDDDNNNNIIIIII